MLQVSKAALDYPHISMYVCQYEKQAQTSLFKTLGSFTVLRDDVPLIFLNTGCHCCSFIIKNNVWKSFPINILKMAREINSYFIFFSKKRCIPFKKSGFFVGLVVFKDQRNAYTFSGQGYKLYVHNSVLNSPVWQEEIHMTRESTW